MPALAMDRPGPPGVRAENLSEFLAAELPPINFLIEPFLPDPSILLLHAKAGVGKTWVALSMGVAVASGCTIWGCKVHGPTPVLFVDGEMPANSLQDRLRALTANLEKLEAASMFHVLRHSRAPEGLPDLSTTEGQALVEREIKRIGPSSGGVLLILDNQSSLMPSMAENEADHWAEVQQWLISLRRRGHSTILVHHQNKSGEQRGTARRLDVLDTSIALAKLQSGGGLRVKFEYEKNRGFYGADAEPFVAEFDGSEWAVVDDKRQLAIKARELSASGLTIREIEKQLEIPKSTVGRWLKSS